MDIMMIDLLTEMTEAEFLHFKAETTQEYAEENVTSGRWPAEGALARSESEMEIILPEGQQTPHHYFFNLTPDEIGQPVGHLWLNVTPLFQSAFVYSIKVDEAYRRRGYAKKALQEAEYYVQKLGIKQLGLHVFTYNEGAVALYQSLGYQTTSINMTKKLG